MPLRCFLALVAAITFCSRQSFAAEAKLPNVVFILADDLGYGDLHCYGHPYARTPHIDELAKQGTLFRQFYATGVTCCPSRTGFMTGKFPATFQKYPAVSGFGDRVTVTELLRKAGYRTGHFGKWHIGSETAEGTYGIESIGSNEHKNAKGQRGDAGGRDAPIFDDAIAFIEKNKDRPFYVNVWGHISHFPVNPAQRFVDEFKDLKVNDADFSAYMREKLANCRKAGGNVDDAMRRYLGDVHSLDLDVGRLLTAIDRLGLRENTIVVFSSDQGAADIALPEKAASGGNKKARKRRQEGAGGNQEFRLNMLGYAGDLRGGKHKQYEGGVRVPFIIRWPGRVPAGRVDERSVIGGIDWLPTLCSLAGVTITSADFDGEDVSQSWLGTEHNRTKPLLWKTSAPGSDPAIRSGQWKLHGSNRKRGPIELYDLANDPGERTNIAMGNPQVVAELTATLARWTKSLPASYDKGASADD